jgi:hypothetical protein
MLATFYSIIITAKFLSTVSTVRYRPAGELCLFPLQPGVQQRIPRRIHQRRMAPQTVVIRIVLPLMLPLASRARVPQNSQHVHVARHQVTSRRRVLITAVGFIPTPRSSASVIVIVIRPAVPVLVVSPGIVVVLPAVVLSVVLVRAAAPIVALLEIVVLVVLLLLLVVMSAWLVSLLA